MKTLIPVRYIPSSLSRIDKEKQQRTLKQSRKLYKNHIYYTRPTVASFHNKTSKHIIRAKKIYHVENITPSKELSQATGCSLKALKKIVNKGEGAYYSSGSRPNQTARSWGLARLASSITSGKSAAVDYDIIEKGCNHRKKAFRMAQQSRKKHGFGKRKTPSIELHE